MLGYGHSGDLLYYICDFYLIGPPPSPSLRRPSDIGTPGRTEKALLNRALPIGRYNPGRRGAVNSNFPYDRRPKCDARGGLDVARRALPAGRVLVSR